MTSSNVTLELVARRAREIASRVLAPLAADARRTARTAAPVLAKPRSRRLVVMNAGLLAACALVGIVRLLPTAPAASPATSATTGSAPIASAAAVAPIASAAIQIAPAASAAAPVTPVVPAASAAVIAPAPSSAGIAALIPDASSIALPSSTGGLDPVDLALKTGVVVLLIVGGLRLLKRFQSGPRRGGDGIVIVETRALAPKATLFVVAVRGRELVLGLTPNGLTTLTEFAEPEAVRQPARRSAATRPAVVAPDLRALPDLLAATPAPTAAPSATASAASTADAQEDAEDISPRFEAALARERMAHRAPRVARSQQSQPA